jgi:hypothetical protein
MYINNLRSITALALSLALVTPAFAVDAGKAQYIGGTVVALKAGAEGPLDLKEGDDLVFGKKTELHIPYKSVTSIEYGQKAGRRVGAAIATAILVSPVGLALLLSHKRNHIVTIAWTVDGHNEAAAFEVGKTAIRPMLTILEARTGHKIEYESEDARKNIGR